MNLTFNKNVRGLVTAVAMSLLASTVHAEERTRPTASVKSHQAAGSDSIYAVSLRADKLKSVSGGHDHVVLIDTSASQKGEHRTQAFGVLENFLNALPADDRVAVFAIDLEVKPVTDGLVKPTVENTQQVLQVLNRRVPLGATNLEAALQHAMQQFNGKRPASILFIGDGMSTANLMGTSQLNTLVTSLRDQKVPVNSYAVGPRTDLALLGVIAQHTGGVVLIDEVQETALSTSQIGKQLAVAVNAPVYYPQTAKFNTSLQKVYPAVALPLRTDRDTVYLAKGSLEGDLTVQLRNTENSLSWSIPQKDITTGFTFLAAAWNTAEQSTGLNIPYAGQQMLNIAQGRFDARIGQMLSVGRRLLTDGNIEQAEAIGLQVQQLDPKNQAAKTLVNAAGKREKILLAQAEDSPKPSLLDKAKDSDGQDLIEQEVKRRRVITQMLSLRVNSVIGEVRTIADTEPIEALNRLKSVLGTVQLSTDIEVEARQQLLRRLNAVIQEVTSRKEVNDIITIRRQQRLAQEQAKQQLIEQSRLEEEKLEQLLDRVRALMVEGEHGNDDAYEEAEAVAEAAWDVRPGLGVTAAAFFNAEAAGQLRKANRLRRLRADRFLETLYLVETSHVPFPDEPPIRWPPAAVWKALTERRRKWSSVSLERQSKSEQRISNELNSLTEVEFIDTPLVDAIEYLADYHNIPIIIDETALEEEGIDTQEPINRVLSGITLRSALKIILEPLELTYVIEDEVMKITTEVKAEDILSTRVYPVGDLVIPITTPLSAGIGQGQGGVGGQQNQNGQFGQNNGQNNGGGQGFFMFAPQALPQKANMNAPQQQDQQKKKKAVKIVDPEVNGILNNILDERTGQLAPFRGQAFAQIADPAAEKPFRLDNKTVKELKKKG